MKTLKSKVLDKLNRKETGKLIKIKIDDVEDEFKTNDKSEKETKKKKSSKKAKKEVEEVEEVAPKEIEKPKQKTVKKRSSKKAKKEEVVEEIKVEEE